MSAAKQLESIDTDATQPARRSHRRWIAFGSVALLIFVIAIVAIDRETRQLIVDAWRQMLKISPAFLLLILAFKFGQALFSALTWRNILAAAYPNRPLQLGFVLGVDQGQDAVNMVSPVRAGTWAMLGIFGLAIPGARAGTLAAVWGVQTIAYAVVAVINYALLALLLPGSTEGHSDLWQRLHTYGSHRPMISTLVLLLVVIVVIVLVVRLRRRVTEFAAHVRQGAAILGSPRRYLMLVFVPSVLSVVCRCGTYAVLLAAFDIPVTLATIALATGAHALAGAVRVTPGGVGTTQAIDIIALRDYAPASAVTAFSLSEAVITAILSFAFSVVAMIATLGFGGTFALVRRRPRIHYRHPRNEHRA